MKNFKKTIELMNKANDILIHVKKNSIEYIKETLNSIDNKEIIFDYDEDEIPYINYDGGNHPEYDAYPYAPVIRIYLKNDIIYADLDDFDDEYDVNERCCDLKDIYEIAEKVYKKMNDC